MPHDIPPAAVPPVLAGQPLTRLINAAGTFTPLGVSRSSNAVGENAAAALRHFLVIDELQDMAGAALAAWTGADAGAVTHCAAAGITLSVAAFLTGNDPDRIAALPDTGGRPNRIALLAGHAVNYGHPIEQDIRLAGGEPVFVTQDGADPLGELEATLRSDTIAGLLLVSSRLVRSPGEDLSAAVRIAHAAGKPVVIDGAAQDWRIPALLDTGADLVVISGHKYLASPTAGFVIGARAMVAAVRAQEKGIGRAMKASKEAIVGLLAAIAERRSVDPAAWSDEQTRKTAAFVQRVNSIAGIRAEAIDDPVGMPFPRAHVMVGNGDPAATRAMCAALKAGDPSIRVMEHQLDQGVMVLELVPLSRTEIDTLVERLAEAVMP